MDSLKAGGSKQGWQVRFTSPNLLGHGYDPWVVTMTLAWRGEMWTSKNNARTCSVSNRIAIRSSREATSCTGHALLTLPITYFVYEAERANLATLSEGSKSRDFPLSKESWVCNGCICIWCNRIPISEGRPTKLHKVDPETGPKKKSSSTVGKRVWEIVWSGSWS